MNKITDSNNLYTISGQTRYSVDTSKSAKQIAETDTMQVTTVGNFVVEKGQYATLYGAVTESKYGYAVELDSVSRDYAVAMFHKDYSGAARMWCLRWRKNIQHFSKIAARSKM